MLMQQQGPSKTNKPIHIKIGYASDKAALAFIGLAMTYLLLGLTFGVLGGFQYVLPQFLKEHLAFQKIRPLHVFLAISWIFSAAQGIMYYYLPRVSKRPLCWPQGVWIHLGLQALVSLGIVVAFFMGYFGGREYLEFPPAFGGLIACSWIPFAVNFFGTLKPDYRTAPVYIWSWSAGIVFFYLTLMESYLWVFDYFRNNEVRDITVQWKALGSMVGSWNMLVYGTSMYLMGRLSGEDKMSRAPLTFFFFFLGFANLMFNWGHHTYIVPAAPWVWTVAYVISMTELLIFGHIILKWKNTLNNAQKNFNLLPYRLLTIADAWIFLNLGVAIAISVPQLNYYTHGTHITVAHAMGTTIGINTMLLFASVLYILQQQKPTLFSRKRKQLAIGITITNISLLLFWTSLVGSGLVKISGKLHHETFATIMDKCRPFFKLFTGSGVLILVGLGVMILACMALIRRKDQSVIRLAAEIEACSEPEPITR
jgi:nitric oxide reductase subunit B